MHTYILRLHLKSVLLLRLKTGPLELRGALEARVHLETGLLQAVVRLEAGAVRTTMMLLQTRWSCAVHTISLARVSRGH